LITGAFAVMQDIPADLSLSRQFFKMPVDGSLPDALFHIIKMTYNLIDCYMSALKGFHVIKNTLSLPGVIIYRTFYHRLYGIAGDRYCQYENEYYFHIIGQVLPSR
jgi:hypothetical protein